MWKKGSSLDDEISRDDFDPSVFIDRVFTRTTGEMRETGVDVEKLKSNFELIISNLQLLRSTYNTKVTNLQNRCKTSEHSFKSDLKLLQHQIFDIGEQFQKLDERIHQVSGKIVHLGDQLERKSGPRSLLQNAKEIIFEFYKFLNGSVKYDITSDQEEDVLLKAAERIQKLSALCLELPDDETFTTAKLRVTTAHESMDKILEERFNKEMIKHNTDSMKRIVSSLSFSKGFSSFITTFVELSVNKMNVHEDLVGSMVSKCSEQNKIIEIVFQNHFAVMLQFIQGFFMNPLKKHIESRIPNASGDVEQHLISLYNFYVRVDAAIKQLASENFIQDNAALNKLFKELFNKYLRDYISSEERWLKERLDLHIGRFYDFIGHTKKPLNEGGFVDYLQSRFNPSGTSPIDDRDTGLLLSQDLAVNVLDDVKSSLKRCRILSSPSCLSENIQKIMDILSEFLILKHLNYGIEFALQGFVSDAKREPNLLFFQVVHEANNIFQFYDKVVSENILPFITNPSIQSNCISKKQQLLKDLEAKINQGLEKLMILCLNYISFILSSEQKKTDYRPENELAANVATSTAANKVVAFLKKLPPLIDNYLDGQNKEIFCQEFGLQFHRLLMDHFYSFTYSCEGGYIAMQDVNMYDEVMRKFNCQLLNHLFTTLFTLMNIVSVKSENLTSIINNHLENGIPKELLIYFTNIRSDYKTIRALIDLK